jgi:protein-tyrosine kinase
LDNFIGRPLEEQVSRFFSALKRHDEDAAMTALVDSLESGKAPGNNDADRSFAEPPPPEVKPANYRPIALHLPAGPLFPFDGSDSRRAEQYRMLRTNILLHPARPKVIAVSSASPGDGKTVTSINLAGTLALKTDTKVLLLDADLRQCRIAASLGIPAAPGLTEVLRGKCSLDETIVSVEEIPSLHVLPCGDVGGNPAELLDSLEWKRIIASLRDRFSYVIVDTTPVAAVADFQLVQQASDAVLLVLRPDHTKRSLFLKALETVPREKLLGTLLNAVPDWFLWGNRDNDYYYAQKDPESL